MPQRGKVLATKTDYLRLVSGIHKVGENCLCKLSLTSSSTHTGISPCFSHWQAGHKNFNSLRTWDSAQYSMSAAWINWYPEPRVQSSTSVQPRTSCPLFKNSITLSENQGTFTGWTLFLPTLQLTLKLSHQHTENIALILIFFFLLSYFSL